MDDFFLEEIGNLRNPVRFDIPLEFPPEDISAFPWLSNRDRYYVIERALDPGGFSIPLVAYASTYDGTRIDKSPKIILKIPNLRSSGRFQTPEIETRLKYIQAQSIAEWAHVRRRLMGCIHANPIFDLGHVFQGYLGTQQLFVTAQLCLDEALPLKKWLVEQHYMQKLPSDSPSNWHGINTAEDFIYIARIIAEALNDIHQRRVVHGDIWPPNVFLSPEPNPIVTLIDFGESFAVTPDGATRKQTDHPYRAPERDSDQYVPTEQIDVYSFGKLLLFLATGQERRIPRFRPHDIDPSIFGSGDEDPICDETNGVLLSGHERRWWVRNCIAARNEGLAQNCPSVVDLIARATTVDPVSRPNMQSVLSEITRIGRRQAVLPAATLLAGRLRNLADVVGSVYSSDGASVFRCLADDQITALERYFASCRTEMIELDGTRDQLIDSMVKIFSLMNKGDSWTAITSPSVWQEYGLGLDGRYLTAAVEAVLRGGAVSRAFIFSVEELGERFCSSWADAIMSCPDRSGGATYFAMQLKLAISEYKSYCFKPNYKIPEELQLRDKQKRLAAVLESLSFTIQYWHLQPFIADEDFIDITKMEGLFLSFIPFGTIESVRACRFQNPVSLLYKGNELKESDKWLLVMTDLRGRNEYNLNATTAPQLRGVRIYKSVMGVPKDRKISLERLLIEKSRNLAFDLSVLSKTASSALESDDLE